MRFMFRHQIHVRFLAAGLARGLPIVSPLNEGAGNAGCALHPRSRVQMARVKTHTSIQGSGEHPTFPAQGKINNPMKFYEVTWSSHPIDHTNNLPITSHVTSL